VELLSAKVDILIYMLSKPIVDNIPLSKVIEN
jgi:hypothetical protein